MAMNLIKLRDPNKLLKLHLLTIPNFFITMLIMSALFNNAYAQNENLSIKSLLGTNQILIIGESYGQIESTDYFSGIVTDYVSEGGCLKVGLEIPSDQQDLLDSAMRGGISMSDVEIDTVIDHDGYREMLIDFSEQIILGKCLSVYAVNPPRSVAMAKDAWMEQQVMKMSDGKPIVLLVGNKHAVKDFNTPEDSTNKLLAQRLRARSLGVSSVLQHWKTGYCATKNVKFYDITTDKKSVMYVKQAIGEISAEMPEKVSMVCDGVMVWSCEKIKVVEIHTGNNSVTDRKLIVEIGKYEVLERDQEVLKKIKWGIKHEYPIVGMNKAEALEAMSEPFKVESASVYEKWIYKCLDEDGFDYECYILKFNDGSLVKFDDLE